MCGVFGYVTRRADEAERIDLHRATRALEHRGPDDAGVFSGQAGGALCGLAHTRLAIIDPSAAGHQPMKSRDGRYVIVYNGEIYNHLEIRKILELEGIELRSTSDTEVVVEAYARWGPAALSRMNGMFAMAIWDCREGELFLARDRLGTKPLYFTTSGIDGIAFSSEIRTLLVTATAPARLSVEGVAGYLHWGSVPEPLTILDHVSSLPAGNYLTLRDGRRAIIQYWRASGSPSGVRTLGEAADHVRPVLERAVALNTIADVPIGIFLSGGLDSSVLTALVSAAQTQPLDSFTVAFDESSRIEARHAAAVASRFGCKHHEVVFRLERLGDELDHALKALDQPSSDGINTFFVARAVRQAGISVALSGLGADELFAGYDLFRRFGTAQRLNRLVPRSLGSWLESIMRKPAASRLSASATKLGGLLAAPTGPFSTYAALRCMFTPSQVERLLVVPTADWNPFCDAPPNGTAHSQATTDPINAYSTFELTHYVKNTLLRDSDTMGMANGLEVRVPYLDHRLIEAVLAIPGHLKVDRTRNKPLLVAAAPRLPDGVTNRTKMGFTLPWDAWLRGPMKSQLDARFSPSSVRRHTFLDANAVASCWSAFSKTESSFNHSRVWCLYALMDWCERNRVTM